MDSLTAPPEALEGVIIPPEGGPSELVLLKRDPEGVFTDEAFINALLAQIGALATAFTPDTTTEKGRKAIASMAYRVSQTKTYLDGIGKDLVAELKDRPKKIDAGRKTFRDGLDALRDEVRQPLNEWEETEKARQAHIQRLRNWSIQAPGTTAEAMRSAITSLKAEPTMGLQEAEEAKQASLASLQEQMQAREVYEAEQTELARLREEAEARRKADEQAEIARKAAEKATQEAEARAQAERDAAARREGELKLAQQQAEQAQRDAEARLAREKEESAARDAQAREDAAAAERYRQDEERRRETLEREARERDQANRKRVLNEALDDCMTSIDSNAPATEIVKNLLLAASRGQIRHLTVTF